VHDILNEDRWILINPEIEVMNDIPDIRLDTALKCENEKNEIKFSLRNVLRNEESQTNWF
jgi:hypothetical protein